MNYFYSLYFIFLTIVSFQVHADKAIDVVQVAPHFTCNTTLDYNLYLNRFHIGEVRKNEKRVGNKLTVSSNSYSKILGIKTNYQQQSLLFLNEQSKVWIPFYFKQIVTGFKNREMVVDYLNKKGTNTSVILNNDVTEYNYSSVLFDVDSLSLEIKRRAREGDTSFKLARQATDKVEPYSYQVETMSVEHVEGWGDINIIKVHQSGADEATFWLAPSLNYEIVNVIYHGIFLNLQAKLKYINSNC